MNDHNLFDTTPHLFSDGRDSGGKGRILAFGPHPQLIYVGTPPQVGAVSVQTSSSSILRSVMAPPTVPGEEALVSPPSFPLFAAPAPSPMPAIPPGVCLVDTIGAASATTECVQSSLRPSFTAMMRGPVMVTTAMGVPPQGAPVPMTGKRSADVDDAGLVSSTSLQGISVVHLSPAAQLTPPVASYVAVRAEERTAAEETPNGVRSPPPQQVALPGLDSQSASALLVALCERSGWDPPLETLEVLAKAGAELMIHIGAEDPVLHALARRNRADAVCTLLHASDVPLRLTAVDSLGQTVPFVLTNPVVSEAGAERMLQALVTHVERHPDDIVDWGQLNLYRQSLLRAAADAERLSLFWRILSNQPFFSDQVQPISLRGTKVWVWDWETLPVTEHSLFSLEGARLIPGDRATAKLCRLCWEEAYSELDLLEQCVAEGADILFKNPVGGSVVLHEFVRHGKLDCVAACLRSPRPINFNKRDRTGWTPLHSMFLNNKTHIHVALVELILNRLDDKVFNLNPPRSRLLSEEVGHGKNQAKKKQKRKEKQMLAKLLSPFSIGTSWTSTMIPGSLCTTTHHSSGVGACATMTSASSHTDLMQTPQPSTPRPAPTHHPTNPHHTVVSSFPTASKGKTCAPPAWCSHSPNPPFSLAAPSSWVLNTATQQTTANNTTSVATRSGDETTHSELPFGLFLDDTTTTSNEASAGAGGSAEGDLSSSTCLSGSFSESFFSSKEAEETESEDETETGDVIDWGLRTCGGDDFISWAAARGSLAAVWPLLMQRQVRYFTEHQGPIRLTRRIKRENWEKLPESERGHFYLEGPLIEKSEKMSKKEKKLSLRT